MLVWRDELSIGHPDIDDDHRRLLAIINDFENLAEKLPDDRVLHETLINLHDYALLHFGREEAIQIACRFPFTDAHRAEHRTLLQHVTDMARRYFIDKTEPVTRTTTAAMAEFLKHWLVDHIIRSDRRMREYLAQRPEIQER